jgi:hypothetical protein
MWYFDCKISTSISLANIKTREYLSCLDSNSYYNASEQNSVAAYNGGLRLVFNVVH